MDIEIHPDGTGRVWPYDWDAKTVRATDGTKLAGGGNHDNNQGELVMQITNLLAAAHFDEPTGYIGSHTPGYTDWAADIRAKLDPIYSDTLAGQS